MLKITGFDKYVTVDDFLWNLKIDVTVFKTSREELVVVGETYAIIAMMVLFPYKSSDLTFEQYSGIK